jgi:type II secretory pathway pseudopilin PulG
MKKNLRKNARRGDTIVEAVIAIAIYSIVAVLALASMNSGLKSAQKNLESTMSRAAVDSQVDAIRYIYDGYIKAKAGGSVDADYFKKLWNQMIVTEVGGLSAPKLNEVITDPDNVLTCKDLMEKDVNGNVFALNPRAIYSQESLGSATAPLSTIGGLKFKNNPRRDAAPELVILKNTSSEKKVVPAPLYPRIVYSANSGTDEELASILIGSNKGGAVVPTRTAKEAQGVWIDLIHEDGKDSYDFYVRTCWNAAGEKSPSTFTTVVRVYKVD